MNRNLFSIKNTLVVGLLLLTYTAFSQTENGAKSATQFAGGVTVTNNGISVIPTFTLGKPAALFDFTVRKNRFAFEPQFRFAIKDAKPWSFVFWMRYKLLQSPKFTLGIGVHPAYVFKNSTMITDGVSKDVITVRRFIAGELTPNYYFSKNVSIGIYYLYSHGMNDAPKNTNFVGLNSNFSNIKLGSVYYLKAAHQIYYLKLDDKDGCYATATVTLAKRNFPFAIASIVNKKIQSNIPSDDFVWNVSLSYSY
jgi:hypothetical protein